MAELEVEDLFNDFLKAGKYQEIGGMFDKYGRILDRENDLAIARVMFSVCQQERTEGRQMLYEKVNSLEEIVGRYTKLMFYLRRIEFDIMDESVEEFQRFLYENRVSPQELFAVLYCGNIDRDKVLRVIKEKMIKGEIVI